MQQYAFCFIYISFSHRDRLLYFFFLNLCKCICKIVSLDITVGMYVVHTPQQPNISLDIHTYLMVRTCACAFHAHSPGRYNAHQLHKYTKIFKINFQIYIQSKMRTKKKVKIIIKTYAGERYASLLWWTNARILQPTHVSNKQQQLKMVRNIRLSSSIHTEWNASFSFNHTNA